MKGDHDPAAATLFYTFSIRYSLFWLGHQRTHTHTHTHPEGRENPIRNLDTLKGDGCVWEGSKKKKQDHFGRVLFLSIFSRYSTILRIQREEGGECQKKNRMRWRRCGKGDTHVYWAPPARVTNIPKPLKADTCVWKTTIARMMARTCLMLAATVMVRAEESMLVVKLA